jgi:glycerol kinase
MTVLAIDQGTTSTRAFRVEDDGTMQPVGQHRHRVFLPRPGWVEHDAAELLEAIRALIAAAGPVDRVGIANQGETVLAWHATTKQPLGRAIVWQDTRTQGAIERLRADGHEAFVRARAGLPLDPYFSAAKLRWLLDHTPDARALLAAGLLRLGTTDAFFLDALTSTFATDPSTASRTSLLDIASLRWDDALCALFGVPVACLPPIRDTVGGFGRLPGGIPVAASVVDQQAALRGHFCREPGDLKITFGTGGFALALTGALHRDATGLLPTCAWSVGGRAEYALDGGITTAGAAVDWLRRVGLLERADALDAARGPSAASQGVFFVPAQAGLGCPHHDRTARALWIGMGLDTTRETLCRAVLEGVALRAAELVAIFAAALGGVLRRLSVDGGLTRSAAFTRFLADALGRPIEVCEEPDITARGLAALCGVAAVDSPPRARTVVPGSLLDEAIFAQFSEAVRRASGWSRA